MDFACIKTFSCLVSRPSWMRRRKQCVCPRGSFCLQRTLSTCQIRTPSLSIARLSRRLATSTLGSMINYTHYSPLLNPRTLPIHVTFLATRFVKRCREKLTAAEQTPHSTYVTFQCFVRELSLVQSIYSSYIRSRLSK